MNLYPALRARMGSWMYYIVKLTMREVSTHVKFASAVHDDHTLDEAIQRAIGKSRVKNEIVAYLQRQEHRFFASLVIAALEGNPRWYPITVADDPKFQLFADDERLSSTFGVLRFDGTQKYYALDGQHRLSAIKTLLDREGDAWIDAPKGFSDEEISVILVTPTQGEAKSDFMTKYRRLFGNLNRYAKPTSHFTNIIMDEDDTFAILTRRLITEYDFFGTAGRHMESERLKMKKGKMLSASSSAFTSLEQLYAMNRTLLTSNVRADSEGWSESNFTRFRLDDDELDRLFYELCSVWDALRETIPELDMDPRYMRCHDREGEDGSDDGGGCRHEQCADSALFWPITQDIVATMARRLLDSGESGDSAGKLAPLAELEYSLHRPPWRNLFLVPTDGYSSSRGRGRWKIRSEDRKEVIRVLRQILMWQLGLVSLSEEEEGELRESWESLLYPQWGDSAEAEMRRQRMWDQIAGSRVL